MYEIHMPLILLAKMKMENGEMSKGEAKKEFHRAILNLKMSLDILKYEPDGSFEKNIYDGAKGSVEPLEAFVSSLWKGRKIIHMSLSRRYKNERWKLIFNRNR